MRNVPFTSATRDHAPLSEYLRSTLRPIADVVDKLGTVAELDEFAKGPIVAGMASISANAPSLARMRPASVRTSEWVTDPRTSKRVLATRHYIVIEVLGDPQMLERWPDSEQPLFPSDAPEWPASGLSLDDPASHWGLSFFDSSGPASGGLSLYTHVDLTLEEEALVSSGELDLRALFLERRERIEPIVEAIHAEALRFYQVEGPRLIGGYIASKRQILSNREAVTDSLAFPDGWVLPTPVLEPQTSGYLSDEEHSPVEMRVPITPRLSAVTFAGLQRTIRIWADSLERYPVAFGVLEEDRISDLLAATLNATLPGAHREVYSRTGKSDIFVTADILSEGSGPAKIFIAESKWVRSEKQVKAALDPQLFSYLTASDTSAVLMLLLRQADRDKAAKRYFEALRTLPAFVSEETSSVEGWPLFLYRHEGRVVRVVVAVIHLPV